MKKFDERDIMFSRMTYGKGSYEYNEYYSRNPDKKEFDDYLRELPNICGEGTMAYHPINAKFPDTIFRFLGDIKHLSSGKKSEIETPVESIEITKRIKKFLKYLGAVEVGICEMKDEFYYSYRGRSSEVYGKKVTEKHKYAICFLVEMDKEMMNRAPMLEEVIEVTKGYLNAGIIGMIGSYFIQDLGYDARNQMDGNFLSVVPLVAREAGLGSLGRNGILTTKKYGSRVRIGVITTDIPLEIDEKDDWGLEEFCEICGKCIKTCPGKSIPINKITDENDNLRWKINHETCYERWRSLGTDCGICITACPFSQGVDYKKINEMKGNKDKMKEILRKHEKDHGIREFIKTPLEILK
ncbi:4Fe-4S dicluster domain-containing protein [Helicovermis profundi]|uniref:Reductive dehalogenase domain-containing protein n=1 Tax=Helicovermis profundi TaxID=3065157 RepID=A0AAU9EQI5_9FIRM|nr:reductive dehalogenase domain-containing protein [Clostridia bacterium S502]